MLRRALPTVLQLVAAALLAFVSVPAVAGFYDVDPGELAGPPGSLIRAEVMDIGTPGASTFRILYRSVAPDGRPIAVSGVVIRPAGRNPPGGRRVVAWAHPTTGVARKCAPSLIPNVLTRIPGLVDMLDRGWAIAATDYPGLGTAGIHPYLVGVSEARAVLDSVRAARAIEEIGAGDRFVVWGHSQGGHAALWTGELARDYAPELKLLGIAAAAPATELGALFEDDLDSLAGRILTAMTLWDWSKYYDTSYARMVLPEAVPAFEAVARECIQSVFEDLDDLEAEKPLQHHFLAENPTKTEPWVKFIAENTPGQLAAGGPLYISQGLADTTVDVPVTVNFVRRLCAQGNRVKFERFPGVNHGDIGKVSADQAVGWMDERFRGAQAPSNCGG